MRLESMIELNRVHHAACSARYAVSIALPGPDLQHDVISTDVCEAADHADDVVVDQEVLAELLLGDGRSLTRGRTRRPRAVVLRSSNSTPRSPASAATVWTRFAGSFGLPRRGWGESVGLSVSAEDQVVGNLAGRGTDVVGVRRSAFPAKDT